MLKGNLWLIGWLLAALLMISSLSAENKLVIGSKRFTESYLLGEILFQLAEQVGEAQVQYKPGLGNTGIVFTALQEGAIDVYPEYTGTLYQEILKLPAGQPISQEAVRDKLALLGLGAGIPLGFNNSYALAINENVANELNITSISDLSDHPSLKLGFSQEFLSRADGWEALKKVYNLPQQHVSGIDHSLSYEALKYHQIELTDVYSTDPKIEKYQLRILKDDQHFFPVYQAFLLYRLTIPQEFPKTWQAFESLKNRMTDEDIRLMNAQAELQGESFASIARNFLSSKQVSSHPSKNRSSFWSHLFGPSLWTLTWQHLFLVFGSLFPAIVIGVLLGIISAYYSSLGHLILQVVGVIQTIPSLALLAFLIPILHQIGTLPALIALFLYALLPIVRNTYAGLLDIPKPLIESSIVLGLPWLPRLTLIEIPLASRTILAGIKTAAVMNVGMATIAALIGAGGFGERILTGLALNNYEILLAGAIPACVLAIFVQLGFDLLDNWLIPKGLKETQGMSANE